MTHPTFDVSKQPCVPVLRGNNLEMLSLRDVLVQAHELREIQSELLTVEFGLYRLLVALVGDIFFVEPGEPLNTKRLGELIARGRFDEARVDAYFQKYEGYFDLFDEERPFLQVAEMKEKEKSIAGLLHPMPSGTNVNHFHHGRADDFAVSPEVAFGLLTAVAPFMTAGGQGLSPSINGAPPIYALIREENLFETICLNLCALPLRHSREEDDAPAWRWARSIGGERSDSGYLESLTWMPRRIHLLLDGPGICHISGKNSAFLVRAMQFVAGDSTRFIWNDPNAAYRISDKGPKILRMQEGKALWRDTAPLVLLEATHKIAQHPRVIDQFAEFVREGLLISNKPLELELFSLRTDLKMKVFEWQRERLILPTPLVLSLSTEANFGLEVQSWMEQAEKAAYYLKQAIKGIYPRDGHGNKKAFEGKIAYVERAEYWETLRMTFDRLLHQLADIEVNAVSQRQPLREAWRKAIGKAARAAFEMAARDLDSSAHALERITRARRLLEAGLKRVFEPASPNGQKSKRDTKSKTKGAGSGEK